MVSVSVKGPIVGGKVVYQRLAPAKAGGPFQARISIRYEVTGSGELATATLNGTKIYADTASTNSSLPRTFQNFDNNALVIDEPVPASMTLQVTGSDGSTAQTTVNLVAHTNDGGPLAFVGLGDELFPNEAWGASSAHPSNHQVFALDTGVLGWNGSAWTEEYLPSPTRPFDWRAYGRPVHAMANGEVVWVLNDHAEWKDLASKKAIIDAAPKDSNGNITDRSSFPQSPTEGYAGGGNQIFVRSGSEIWVVAHLQPGSIPAQLTVGKQVTKGQYLGKVGWSGDSSRPHTHIHVKSVPSGFTPGSLGKADGGEFRPMAFKDLHALTHAEANAKPTSTWTSLTNHSAAQPYDLLFSGPKPPAFLSSPLPPDNTDFTAVWHPAGHIDLRVVMPTYQAFEQKWAALMDKDSFVLKGIEPCVIAGKLHFAGLFHHGTGGQGLLRLTNWNTFVSEATKFMAQGNVLIDMATFVENGVRSFIGVFNSGSGGVAPIRVNGLEAFVSKAAELRKTGVNVVGIDSYVDGNGNPMVLGALAKSTKKQQVVMGLGWDSFAQQIGAQKGMRVSRVASVPDPLLNARKYVGVFDPDPGTGQMVQRVTSYREVFRRCEKYVGWRLVHLHRNAS